MYLAQLYTQQYCVLVYASVAWELTQWRTGLNINIFVILLHSLPTISWRICANAVALSPWCVFDNAGGGIQLAIKRRGTLCTKTAPGHPKGRLYLCKHTLSYVKLCLFTQESREYTMKVEGARFGLFKTTPEITKRENNAYLSVN